MLQMTMKRCIMTAEMKKMTTTLTLTLEAALVMPLLLLTRILARRHLRMELFTRQAPRMTGKSRYTLCARESFFVNPTTLHTPDPIARLHGCWWFWSDGGHWQNWSGWYMLDGRLFSLHRLERAASFGWEYRHWEN